MFPAEVVFRVWQLSWHTKGCCPTKELLLAAVPWNPLYTVRRGAELGRMVFVLLLCCHNTQAWLGAWSLVQDAEPGLLRSDVPIDMCTCLLS